MENTNEAGWVVKGTAGHFLRETEHGFEFLPGLLGACAFEDRDEAACYAERAGDAPIMENPFHRCPCGAVSMDTRCGCGE